MESDKLDAPGISPSFLTHGELLGTAALRRCG